MWGLYCPGAGTRTWGRRTQKYVHTSSTHIEHQKPPNFSRHLAWSSWQSPYLMGSPWCPRPTRCWQPQQATRDLNHSCVISEQNQAAVSLPLGRNMTVPLLKPPKQNCLCSRKHESGNQGMVKSQRGLIYVRTYRIHSIFVNSLL